MPLSSRARQEGLHIRDHMTTASASLEPGILRTTIFMIRIFFVLKLGKLVRVHGDNSNPASVFPFAKAQAWPLSRLSLGTTFCHYHTSITEEKGQAGTGRYEHCLKVTDRKSVV